MIRLALMALALATPAAADPVCFPREAFEAVLVGKYAPVTHSAALAASGELVEILTWSDNSFAIYVTVASGFVCVLTQGTSFSVLPVGEAM